jgi:iron(III) transport system substrate-binding protein
MANRTRRAPRTRDRDAGAVDGRPGVDYSKKLHANINNYPRSGTGPIKAVAAGRNERLDQLHPRCAWRGVGRLSARRWRCEGTGYEIVDVDRVARTDMRRSSRLALSADAQKIAAQTKQFQLPSNKNAPQPPEAPRFADMKLIDSDQLKYGSVAERKRLIARWEKDVNAGGK